MNRVFVPRVSRKFLNLLILRLKAVGKFFCMVDRSGSWGEVEQARLTLTSWTAESQP